MITREEQAEIRKNWPEIIDAIRAQGISFERSEGFEYAVEGVYRFLPNIQTLVIGEPSSTSTSSIPKSFTQEAVYPYVE